MHNNRDGGGKFGKVTFFLILGILIVLIVEAVVLRFQVVSVKKKPAIADCFGKYIKGRNRKWRD